MSWKHFVIYHKYLIDQAYPTHPNIKFVKCNPDFPDEFGNPDIVESQLAVYNPKLQSKQTPYHAASFLYHAYKNGLHNDLDYLGFSEYDIILQSDIVRDFETLAESGKQIIIPLSFRWPFEFLASQTNILAAGRQCMSTIVYDYNQFWGTKWSLAELLEDNPIICTQQSFWCDRKSFERLMKFICHVIDQGLAERKGSRPRPSTLIERYIGVALYLDAKTETIEICAKPQEHLSKKEWNYDQRKIQMLT